MKRKPKHGADQIGYSIRRWQEHNYGRLEIEVRQFTWIDCIKRLSEYPEDQSRVDLYCERMKKIAFVTGGTLYLQETYWRNRVDFEWQESNDDRNSWYGGHVRCALEGVDFAKKIMPKEPGYRFGPRAMIDHLTKTLHAIPVCHNNDVDQWLPNTAFVLAESVPLPLRHAPTEERTALCQSTSNVHFYQGHEDEPVTCELCLALQLEEAGKAVA